MIIQGNRTGATVDLGSAGTHRDHCRVLRIHRDPVVARLAQQHRRIRRVDLESLRLTELAHVNAERSGIELELHDVGVEVGDRQVGVLVEPDGRNADAHFRARATIGHQSVAPRERPVELGSLGRTVTGGLERHRSLREAETRDARRRIVLGEGGGGDGEGQQEGEHRAAHDGRVYSRALNSG